MVLSQRPLSHTPQLESVFCAIIGVPKVKWVACGGEGLHNDGLWSRESSPTHCSLQGPIYNTGIHLKQGKTK